MPSLKAVLGPTGPIEDGFVNQKNVKSVQSRRALLTRVMSTTSCWPSKQNFNFPQPLNAESSDLFQCTLM